MSFPRYPKYKDSGVEWLGQVPERWDVISIKWLSQVKRGASPRPIDDPKYFDDEGEFAWVRIADVSACREEARQRLVRAAAGCPVGVSFTLRWGRTKKSTRQDKGPDGKK